MEKKIGLKRQKKMSSALLSLSRSVQELTEENQSLKEDLDRMLSNSPTASKIKGTCPGPRGRRACEGTCSSSATPLGSAASRNQPAVGRARSWTPGRAVEACAGGGGCPVSPARRGQGMVLDPGQSRGGPCSGGRLPRVTSLPWAEHSPGPPVPGRGVCPTSPARHGPSTVLGPGQSRGGLCSGGRLPCVTSLPWAGHGPGPRAEPWRPVQWGEAAPCHQPALG